MILTLILMLVGFFLLYKGADLLVDGATSVAARLRVSDFIVGMTIVAFGTSLPELFVSVIGSVRGTTDIVAGNVIGSCTINIFVILGLAAVIFPLAVKKGAVWKEIPFTLFAILLLALLANDWFRGSGGVLTISRVDGIVLLAFFVLFLIYAFAVARDRAERDESIMRHLGMPMASVYIVLGLVGLSLGARWVIDGAVYVATLLGVSQKFIALTIVAGGTSLPELAASAVAAYKKNAEIAVGNIVGSNIFNIMLVLGVGAVIRPIPFPLSGNIDIAMATLGSLMLFIFMFTGKRHKLDRWEGVMFLVMYAAYLAFLIKQA